MNDPFYATIKLVTGEEVLAQAIHSEENGVEFFILEGAIIIDEKAVVDPDRGVLVSSMASKKWPLFSSDDLSIVYKDKVVTVSELDEYGRQFYEKALMTARVSNPVKRKMESKKHTGYLGSTKDIREMLERIYKSDEASKDDPS